MYKYILVYLCEKLCLEWRLPLHNGPTAEKITHGGSGNGSAGHGLGLCNDNINNIVIIVVIQQQKQQQHHQHQQKQHNNNTNINRAINAPRPKCIDGDAIWTELLWSH